MMTDPQPQDTSEGTALYCPACGYDLRHTEEPRCPECGSAFDRNTLIVSRIPWVHRRELGRVTAWWRTMTLAIFSPNKLAQEVALPVSWVDASRFRWVTIWGVSIGIATISSVLYRWADLTSFRVDCSAWLYAGTPFASSTTIIYPLEYPLVALLTGAG